MNYLPGIFALLVLACGWYYLLYSSAAGRLQELEGQRKNATRVRLRRINGLMMMLLAVSLYAGIYTVDINRPTTAFLWVWLAVFVLMAGILILAIVDLRMTRAIRRQIDRERK